MIAEEWIEQIAIQYGTRQAAALRGDDAGVRAANNWIHRIADDHWHEIIAAVRRRPLSEEVTASSPGQLLYAAPPRREWVGLTDADFKKEKFVDYNFMAGASFAEAKLKEKNGEHI